MLIAVCLLMAVFLSIFFIIHRRTGSIVTISYDGMELYRIDIEDISSDDPHYYLIEYREEGQDIHIMHSEHYPELPETQHYNLFTVVNGMVTMEAADCRDQICVRHIPIENARESIICLPNKLVIEIDNNADISIPQTEESDCDGKPEDESYEKLDGVVG